MGFLAPGQEGYGPGMVRVGWFGGIQRYVSQMVAAGASKSNPLTSTSRLTVIEIDMKSITSFVGGGLFLAQEKLKIRQARLAAIIPRPMFVTS